ncbi:DUF7706 family protein [Izhakiella capsodis]
MIKLKHCNTHQDCAERSTSEDEAYLMMDGVKTVMRELAESGSCIYR